MPTVRPHTVTIYRRGVTGVDEYRRQVTGWTVVATGVRCDVQPRGGAVEQQAYGREPVRRAMAFFDTGTDLQPDDGVLVTAGPGPRRWIARTADDWGEPGDLECELEETAEAFG